MSVDRAEDGLIELPDRRLRSWRFHPLTAATDPYAPTLVFLHEGLGCVELWRGFPAAVCARIGLSGFAYDRTGCGGSSPWPAAPGTRYLDIEAGEILPQVLDAAGIQSCLLIGHADGSTIALRFAAMQPPLLRGVVAIAPQATVEPRTLASLEHAREAFSTTDLRRRLALYHGENVDEAFHTWNDAWLTPGFDPLEADRRLPRIRVPVLAVQGELDEYGTVAQLTGIARRVSGRCETRQLPGCGHAPHLQDAETLVEIVARFVTSLWRGPGDARRAATAVLIALACGLGIAETAAARQADGCATADVRAALEEARGHLDRVDDEAAAERLRQAQPLSVGCADVGVAALAMDGWAEARRLALVGGAPEALPRMREVLARLDTIRAGRPPTALFAQQVAYGDAVLRAAVAAAQDEREEMQVYLAHARTLAESLRLAGLTRPWPLPMPLVEGELWFEVDRFREAADALALPVGEDLAVRAGLTRGLALSRLGDVAGACTALVPLVTAPIAAASRQRAADEVRNLGCGH